MAQEDLIPMNQRTEEEQKRITTAGGIASGKARRRKKAMREWAEIIGALDIKVVAPDGKELAEADLDADVVMQQYKKAHKGDTRAAAFLANLKGEEQQASVQQTTIVVQNEEQAQKLRDIDKLGV